MITHVISAHAAHAVTPANEVRACVAVARYHTHHTIRLAVRALSAARHADSIMRADIFHYVRTGRGWSHVFYDCNPDA
jgi:hypothetical protein